MKNGCYKLSWRERIGFSAGDLAQNLIYQTVSIWLLFFYTNVYGLKPSVSAVMFLVVRIIDVIWDPIVGAFIDKANPRWGKYRSWLLFAGIPLAAFAMLCFWNGFSGSLLYVLYIDKCALWRPQFITNPRHRRDYDTDQRQDVLCQSCRIDNQDLASGYRHLCS